MNEYKVLMFTKSNFLAVIKDSGNNLKINDKFVLFYYSKEDIIDYDTNENYGKLEIVIGKGEVTNIQDNGLISIESIEFDSKGSKLRKSIFSSIPETQEELKRKGFEVPQDHTTCYARKY